MVRMDEGLPPVAGVAGQDARRVCKEKEAAWRKGKEGSGDPDGTEPALRRIKNWQSVIDC